MANKKQSHKLTIKQSRFCEVYAETANATEAYRQVYKVDNMKPQTINRAAFDLLQNAKITTRLSELQALAQERHLVTIDSLCAELSEDRELAHREGQAGAAVSATMGKAKLHGLDVNKHEIDGYVGITIASDEEDF